MENINIFLQTKLSISMKLNNYFLRWLPILILVLALFLIVYLQWYKFLSFDTLQKNHQFLSQWTQAHYLLAVLCFMSIYIVAVAVSIPGAVFLTLAGGFLFGSVLGTLYVVLSATMGATLLFLQFSALFLSECVKSDFMLICILRV